MLLSLCQGSKLTVVPALLRFFLKPELLVVKYHDVKKKLWSLQNVFVLWSCYIGLTENSCLNDVCIKGGQNGRTGGVGLSSTFRWSCDMSCLFTVFTHLYWAPDTLATRQAITIIRKWSFRYLTTRISIPFYRMNSTIGPHYVMLWPWSHVLL